MLITASTCFGGYLTIDDVGRAMNRAASVFQFDVHTNSPVEFRSKPTFADIDPRLNHCSPEGVTISGLLT